MDNPEKKQRKFHTKNRLLTLYLSIGIIGICMLAFSAWTPLTAHNDTSAESGQHNMTEHDPGNTSQNPSVPDQDADNETQNSGDVLIPS